MSPEPNPAHLLSPEQLIAITEWQETNFPTERSDDESLASWHRTDDLLAHIAAREAQVKQALARLLLHSLEKLPVYSPYRELGEACNRDVHAAAKELGIDL